MADSARAVLVTGGAGYIGSHAAKALHRAGYRVIVFDNLVAGHRAAVRYGQLVEGDIADVAALRAVLRQHQVVGVMHFAAFLDVGESVRDPIRYYRNNVIGALGVLEAMAAEAVTNFVFSSTCATYGEPIETPITETHPQNPINSYGETKLAVEQALPHLEAACGFGGCAALFQRLGGRPDGGSADHRRKSHHPADDRGGDGDTGAQVFGDDYPTPDGTCRATTFTSPIQRTRARARSNRRNRQIGRYNLGTGRPHSVKEVIDTVERVTGRQVPWTLAPRPRRPRGALTRPRRRPVRNSTGRRNTRSFETIVRTA